MLAVRLRLSFVAILLAALLAPARGNAQVVGCALSFDGTDDYLEMTESASINFGESFSAAFWIKSTDATGGVAWYQGSFIFLKDVAGAGTGDWSAVLNGGQVIIVTGTNGVTDEQTSTSTPVNDDTWHHVVMTRDNSSGLVSIYVDNSLQAQQSHGVGSVANNINLNIAGREDGYASLEAELDDIRLYDRVLNDSEISQIYNSGAGSASNSISDLVGWWKFDGGSGGTAVDSSGFGNHATINGATWIGSCEPASSSASSSGSTPVPEFSTWAMIVALGLCGWELHRRGLLPTVRLP